MAMVTPKTMLGIAAGVCGSLFLGYCIYFDYRRHQDPDFKKKLRERRRAKKEAASSGRRATTNFPNIKDRDAVQMFFLQEVQLGEELMSAGDLENCVDHFANAIAVCGQTEELLRVFQQTLPPQVFHMLLKRLPSIAPRLVVDRTMKEDDVE